MVGELSGDRICFVIAPIGEEGTDIRIRSDQILKHIISPAVGQCGYRPIRADQISEPGLITSQVIQHIVQDPLVIADLTGRNPNVYYELALRHALKKPVVQIIQKSESIPFDIAATRTVQVDHRDLDSVASCKEELVKQIQAVERNPGEVDTPISVAIELQSLWQSGNPLEKSNAEILSLLQEMRATLVDLRDSPSRFRVPRGIVQELAIEFDRLQSLLHISPGEESIGARLEEAAVRLERIGNLMDTIFVQYDVSPAFFTRRFPYGRSRPTS